MATSTTENELGFVGLGKMGGALAARLLGGGCTLHVYDPNPAAVEHLLRLGAHAADSPKAVADRARIVFASLPSPQASIEVALGEHGVIHGWHRAIYVETSTSGRLALRTIDAGLRAVGVAVLDAPVSGGVSGAEKGALAVLLAGERAVIEQVRPYIEMYGQRIFEIGAEPGMAQLMKLLNNLIGAALIAASFEALVVGAKAGLDARTMVDVINASSGHNSATERKIPRAVLTRSFDSGGRIGNKTKEFKLVLAEAQQLGVPMWVSSTVAQLFDFAAAQGGPNDDTMALIKQIERWAGVEVGGK